MWHVRFYNDDNLSKQNNTPWNINKRKSKLEYHHEIFLKRVITHTNYSRIYPTHQSQNVNYYVKYIHVNKLSICDSVVHENSNTVWKRPVLDRRNIFLVQWTLYFIEVAIRSVTCYVCCPTKNAGTEQFQPRNCWKYIVYRHVEYIGCVHLQKWPAVWFMYMCSSDHSSKLTGNRASSS